MERYLSSAHSASARALVLRFGFRRIIAAALVAGVGLTASGCSAFESETIPAVAQLTGTYEKVGPGSHLASIRLSADGTCALADVLAQLLGVSSSEKVNWSDTRSYGCGWSVGDKLKGGEPYIDIDGTYVRVIGSGAHRSISFLVGDADDGVTFVLRKSD